MHNNKKKTYCKFQGWKSTRDLKKKGYNNA